MLATVYTGFPDDGVGRDRGRFPGAVGRPRCRAAARRTGGSRVWRPRRCRSLRGARAPGRRAAPSRHRRRRPPGGRDPGDPGRSGTAVDTRAARGSPVLLDRRSRRGVAGQIRRDPPTRGRVWGRDAVRQGRCGPRRAACARRRPSDGDLAYAGRLVPRARGPLLGLDRVPVRSAPRRRAELERAPRSLARSVA